MLLNMLKNIIDIQEDSIHFLLTKIHFQKAAAAAKSFQSCPSLCDPMDGSPPGPAVPGVL